MPIRPENRARYPKDWKAISARIRRRARNRCECKGECGRGTPRELVAIYRAMLAAAHPPKEPGA